MCNNKVKLSQTEVENLIEKHYKNSENKDICFKFLFIFYQLIGPNHLVYNSRNHLWEEQEAITDMWDAIPCIINREEYAKFTLNQLFMQKNIEKPIRQEDLKRVLDEQIPKSINKISYDKINSILNEYGYENIELDFFTNKSNNREILYTAELTKINECESNIKVFNKKLKLI